MVDPFVTALITSASGLARNQGNHDLYQWIKIPLGFSGIFESTHIGPLILLTLILPDRFVDVCGPGVVEIRIGRAPIIMSDNG